MGNELKGIVKSSIDVVKKYPATIRIGEKTLVGATIGAIIGTAIGAGIASGISGIGEIVKNRK